MRRMDDEELLERILDSGQGDGACPGEPVEDPESLERLSELSSFVVRARSASASAGGVRTEAQLARLKDKVLARTTREDLSWRGDFSLYGRFLRSRLAGSGWLQLAAASLLVHLIALPALAIYVLVSTPPAPEIGFISYEDYYPVGFPEHGDDGPVPELDVPETGDDLEGLPAEPPDGGGGDRTPR